MKKIENINSFKFHELLLDYQEYYLLFENIIYKIIVGNYKNEIIIKIRNYTAKFNLYEFSKLINYYFNNIINAYEYVLSKFEQNLVIRKR